MVPSESSRNAWGTCQHTGRACASPTPSASVGVGWKANMQAADRATGPQSQCVGTPACMVDAGVNLVGPGFPDADAVVTTAGSHGVHTLLCICSTLACNEAVAAVAARHGGRVVHTLGLHPQNAKSVNGMGVDRFVEGLRRQVEGSPACVAIGECGLDTCSEECRVKPAQRRVFSAQVELAKALGKPLYLHCRHAHGPFVRILREHGYARGLVHCFTGSAEQARELVGMGLYIGFAGVLLDPRRNAQLELALRSGAVPLHRVILETDAPWMPIPPATSSTPVDVLVVLRRVADLLGESLDAVRSAVVRNVEVLFGITVCIHPCVGMGTGVDGSITQAVGCQDEPAGLGEYVEGECVHEPTSAPEPRPEFELESALRDRLPRADRSFSITT